MVIILVDSQEFHDIYSVSYHIYWPTEPFSVGTYYTVSEINSPKSTSWERFSAWLLCSSFNFFPGLQLVSLYYENGLPTSKVCGASYASLTNSWLLSSWRMEFIFL